MPFVGIGVGIGRQRFRGGGILPFEFTIDTNNTSTGSSNSDQFKLPLVDDGNMLNAVVDWGDGNTDTITVWNQAETTHTYASSGVYTIKITGDLSGWKFAFSGDRLKILNINSWGILNISTDSAFHGCFNMTCNALDVPIISTTNLTSTFREALLFNGNIGNWNVSNVTNFITMFRRTFNFNQDISNWDIRNMTTALEFMLQNTSFSTVNYDKLLVGWEITLQSSFPNGLGYARNINIHFGIAKYTIGSAAATARASLISNFGWTITDGGGI